MATGLVDWAAREADRAAVVDVGRTLTLGELEAAAAVLAARLLDGARRSGGEQWLPVVVDRSVASPVALHGAIRAGCAFAPIESTLPRELVAELFARLGHPDRAIVADPAYAQLLPTGVEPITAWGHGAVGAAPPQPVDHDAPGDVLFTSGSTGRPKGVVLPWRVLDGRVEGAQEFGPHGDHRPWAEGFVQPFGFAAAFRRVALPSVGRTLCIADPTTMSVDDLLDWLAEQQIDSVSLPPSLASAMLRVADGRPRLPSVSVLRWGGEASDWALVEPLRRLVGSNPTIRVGYAASEVGSITSFEIGPHDPIGKGRIPLGPIAAGVQVRLEPLDDDPSMTQLLIAHPRSFGYLGEPELTARKYITDDDGVRWWKSGDLVRVDDAGLYHHLGRADEMVKIHGMFVAPSRVEEALRNIDGIGAAAVMPHRAPTGSVCLVAHVQVDDDTLTPEAVDARLREVLPGNIVPAIVVRHDELPRTERQKVDRRSLDQAPLARWRSVPIRGTRSEFELWCLAEVRRIVGLDDIGLEDDLFEVGMDSLSALELCAALADAGFENVDPATLIEARTIVGLERVLTRTHTPDASSTVGFNGSGTRMPVFALPGGGGTALEYRFVAEALGSDRPLLVIEPRGMHRPGPPDRSVAAAAAHVADEIGARLGPDDPCVLLGYSGSGPVAYEAAQQMHTDGRRVHLILLDTAPSMRRRSSAEAATPAARDEVETRPVGIRSASAKELPGAVLRSVRFRRRALRLKRLARDPGPPSFDADRYLAFKRIQGDAGRAYEPAPAQFATTLIHVEDNGDVVNRCQQLIPDLTVRVVGGNHKTMLVPPEVTGLAALIAAATDGAFLSTTTR
jgi:acyl-coenzyme A synthetase/AMP-(fatty) acid ligase/thioesterase domain-containing protein